MAKVEALITPSVLAWAREQSGLSIEVAAKKIGRPMTELLAWESGKSKPSIPQARNISKVYKRPLAVFYLPNPPEEFDTLRDFRSLPIDWSPDFSPELSLLIRTAKYRMNWMHDYLRAEGFSPLNFVGSASLQTPSIDVCQNIFEVLQLTPHDQIECRNRDEVLRLWIEKAERVGIYIFRKGQINLKEVRGFVLCDEYAPFIYINSGDAKAAQIFTLTHELAHLWLNESGISNLEPIEAGHNNEAAHIEVYCNTVASELILNRTLFDLKLQELDKSVPVSDQIEELSIYFKVSEEVIARRMMDDGYLTTETYLNLRRKYQERWQAWKKKERLQMKAKGRGPSYYRTKAFNNGYLFTQNVISAFESGAISGREASGLLDVKVNNIRKLADAAGMTFF